MKILIAIGSKNFSKPTLRLGMKVAQAFKAKTTIIDVGEKAIDPRAISISSLNKIDKSLAPDFSGHAEDFNVLSYGVTHKSEEQIILTGNGTEAILLPAKVDFLNRFNDYKSSLLKQ